MEIKELSKEDIDKMSNEEIFMWHSKLEQDRQIEQMRQNLKRWVDMESEKGLIQ